MPLLDLSFKEKDDVQIFIETLLSVSQNDFTGFTRMFARGNEAAWRRFVKGAYNHPVTWWIGIFQLQMQMGVWGFHP